jgi:hypothetical protein
MTMRHLLNNAINVLDNVEINSGLHGCLALNETTSSVNKVVHGSDFMDLVYTLMLFAGIITTYFGHRIVKPVIFTVGVTLGSMLGTYASMYYSSWFSMTCKSLYIVSGLSAGIGGSLALSIYKIANALLGFSLGSSLGYFVYNLGLDKFQLGEFMFKDGMYWLCVGIPAVLAAWFCVNKNQEILMLLTPIPGALMFLYAIDHLIVSNVNGGSVLEKFEWRADTWTEIIYAFMWVLMSVSGMWIQYHQRHKKVSYTGNDDSIYSELSS